MWEIKFTVYSEFKETVVPIISCVDLIESWTHLAEAERKMLMDELPSENYSLCPNLTEF